MTQNLADRVTARLAEKRAVAAEGFRELLLRSSRPAEGDEDRLVDLMAQLGVEAAELPELQTLLGRLRDCEQLAGNVENLQDELVKKHKLCADAIAWSEKARVDLETQIKAKLIPLETQRTNAEARYKDAKAAKADASRLHDEWDAFVQGIGVNELIDARRARMQANIAAGLVPAPVHGPGVKLRG